MKRILLPLLAALALPTAINAEPYPRHKYTCEANECTDGEIAAVKLVNDKYWKMLSDRIKENKHYKYPWYFVIKRKKNANIQLLQKRICELILQIWNGLMLIFAKKQLS